MLTPICPKCGGVLSGDAVNVVTDVAYCRSCNVTHRLSSLALGPGIDPNLDLARPPEGVWHHCAASGIVIGATQRSLGGAVALFALAAFWNGILSIFLGLALSSTWALLGYATVSWLPKPIMNHHPMGIGMTLFLWVFLSPFILIGIAFAAAFLSCLAGRTEIHLRDQRGELFSGIGRFGVRRRFETASVTDVRIEDKKWVDSDGDRRRSTQIVLDIAGGKPIKFGSSLREDRRQFLAAVLRSLLVAKKTV